jgi:Na+/proline symporter
MVDFYERLIKRKDQPTSQKEPPGEALEYENSKTAAQARADVRLSRIITVCFGIIGILIAANVSRLGNIIEIAQKVIQTYTGPMLGIYLLGMFTRRANATGALLGGILGTGVGIFVAFFFKDAQGHDRITFLWPTVFGFVITFVSGYLISLISPATLSQRAARLNWFDVMKRPLEEILPEIAGAKGRDNDGSASAAPLL